MADRAADKTLADFIAGALSPPLIMAMVGSLVFFLLEILYDGLYRASLQWVLFFFVFGSVLVARIAIQGELAGRAWPYGAVLGGLVWLALQQYVDYSENPALAGRSGLINLGLILLIWWSAHQLTKDCTYLDDESSSGGAGLLDEAGLDPSAQKAPPPQRGKIKKARKAKKPKPEEQPGFPGWSERFRSFQEQRKAKPRTLGLWVVFFSLAALPLFGLGQAQIPVAEVARRRFAFSLLMTYVGAGLGLLLTTSFLGLRSYLRQRKVTMPPHITLSWLFLGAALIGGHLFVSSLLPRPADPQPLWDWTGLTGPRERAASRVSPFHANESRKKQVETPENKDQSTTGKSADDGKDSEGTKDSGGKKDKGSASKDQAQRKEQQRSAGRAQGNTTPPALGGFAEFLTKLGRWLIIALLVIIVVFFVGGGLLRFLANFTFWAQKLLALFENFQITLEKDKANEPTEKSATPRPFASFTDPYESGRVRSMAPADLVRYSFAALQAWGRENDLARTAGETPLEYAQRIGEESAHLGEEACHLANLYARLAYSTDTLFGEDVDELREFWLQLGRGAEKQSSH
jgi:hypothetical protein